MSFNKARKYGLISTGGVSPGFLPVDSDDFLRLHWGARDQQVWRYLFRICSEGLIFVTWIRFFVFVEKNLDSVGDGGFWRDFFIIPGDLKGEWNHHSEPTNKGQRDKESFELEPEQRKLNWTCRDFQGFPENVAMHIWESFPRENVRKDLSFEKCRVTRQRSSNG